jgi:hypothetical protein
MKLLTRSTIMNSLVVNPISGFKWIWWSLVLGRRLLRPFFILPMLGPTSLAPFHGYQPILHGIHLTNMLLQLISMINFHLFNKLSEFLNAIIRGFFVFNILLLLIIHLGRRSSSKTRNVRLPIILHILINFDSCVLCCF